MPLYHREHKDLNYILSAGVFPQDLVLIHGNLASTRWWQPVMQILEQERSSEMHGNALAMDWIGCGGSSAPASEMDLSMEEMAKDQIALIRAAGLSKVCLVGHSTGASIALIMALRAPELIAKILLLDPVAADGIQFGPEMFEAFTKMSEDREFCETVLMGTVYGVNTKKPFFQALCDDAFGVHKMIWHGIPRQLAKFDVSRELGNIRQPVLVLHGEHDGILPVAGAQAIAEGVVNGEFELLKGRGHCPNVEDPTMVVARMREFFS